MLQLAQTQGITEVLPDNTSHSDNEIVSGIFLETATENLADNSHSPLPSSPKDDISVTRRLSNFEPIEATQQPKTPEESGTHQEWVSMDVDKFGKSFYNSDMSPLNEQIKLLKLKTLMEYLNNSMTDEIREYLRSTDGLINNELRRKIWPILLKIDDVADADKNEKLINTDDATLFLDDLNLNDIALHKDEEQVKLDIKRSFTILNHIQSSFNANYSFATIYSNDEISYLKKNLYNLVVKFLRKYPCLHYYQGFHDIASIILIVCYNPITNKVNENLSYKLLEKLALNHLRDYMVEDINLSLVHLKLIPTLLEIVDHQFFKLIKQLSNNFINSKGSYYDYSFYQGLSSILTMFSHDIDNLNQLLTVWDFALSYESILINIYIFVAVLVFKKEEIYKTLNLNPETSNYWNVDKDILHTQLSASNLFKNLNDTDIIKILNNAKFYYESYPITKLSNSSYTFDIWFKEYNVSSVLQNTSKPYSEDCSSLLLVNNPSKVEQTIQLQDEEISRLVIFNLGNERKIIDDIDDTTEYDGSTSLDNSMSSSLSSLRESTSTLNSKILKTSSVYFKKLMFSDASKDNGEPSKKPTANIFKLTTIYKISLTVGFLGFLLHILMTRNQNAIFNFTNLTSFRLSNATGFFNNIGLGSIRSSIYGYLS